MPGQKSIRLAKKRRYLPFSKGRASTVPVIAVGRIQRRVVVDRILREGKADLIALGRQLLADPFWPEKLRQDKEEDVVLCTYCDCCSREMRAGRPIFCTQNPNLGREKG